MGLEKRDRSMTYAKIIADGSIRINSAESNPEAVRRDYELRDGTKGTKWELVYDNLRGHINDVEFEDGQFGVQLKLHISDSEGANIILAVPTAGKYADDILKKLPNVDYSKDVNLVPYSFLDDKNKEQKGVSIYQDLGDVKPEKLTNYFYDSANKKSKDGYPDFPEDYKDFDKDDWKIHFIKCRKFLQKFTEDNVRPLILANSGVVGGDQPEEEAGENIEDVEI